MPAAPLKPTSAPASVPSIANDFGLRGCIALGALLVALVFGAFINGLKSPYLFDDNDSIPNNVSIRSLKTALAPPLNNGITVSGRPVLNFSFAVNYLLGGTDKEGIRFGNIFIHALAAFILWGVVRRTLLRPILAGRFARDATWLAWLMAALWAVHPLQTESVTYAVQRAESLVGLLYLLTLYCFIRYTEARNYRWFAASVFSCLLGMGAKEVMATAPFVIFLYDRAFISGTFRKAWQQHGRLHLGHAAALLLLGGLVLSTRNRGGSVGTDNIVTHWNYLCTQTYALVRYIRLSLWPTGLTLDYGTLIVKQPEIFVPCGLFVLAALAATIWAVVRKPAIGFLGVWFFGILAPSSSFIPVNTQTIAEHRMYLPLAGVIIGLALAAHQLLGRRSWILLALAIVPATAVTITRNSIYLDEATMWQDTVSKRPENPRAWVSLGAYRLHKEKQPAAAQIDFGRALQINPNHKEALNGLGQVLVKLGQPTEGIALVEKSLRFDPESYSLNAGAGAAYMDAGLYEKAVFHLSKALAPNPASASLNYNLANSLMKLGRNAEAEDHFHTALQGSPDDIDALTNLGALLRRSGRIDEAIGYFGRAIELEPCSAKAHNNIGIAYMMQGKTAEGLKHLREAFRIEPGSYETGSNLAQALAHSGQVGEAIPLCEKLLQEKPDAELYNNLGALYGQTGQLNKAAAAFRAALQVDPNNANARENYTKLRDYLDAQAKP